MKEALALYVELDRSRHALTMEALAEVDAGQVVDHSDVEAWAAKVAPPRRRKR